ncbi:MAG: hypothetical protein HY646_06525 [Acidobacteria bacterium]|nr:hypothetical protein [Acidobacteriota bacterium]
MWKIITYAGIILSLSSGIRLAGSQDNIVPNTWLGVWKLNAAKSSFDERALVTITDQTLILSATQTELTVTGETTLPDGRRLAETSTVQLNGKETVVAPDIVASFKRIDERAFEITVTANTTAGKGIGVNHFAVLPDGKTLTETKTQTLKAAVPTGSDPEKAPVIGTSRSSRSVLVFEKQDLGR